jgi:hypothetical protein
MFNLLLGLVLKIAPANPAPLFDFLWICMGLAMGLALYQLMIRLRISPTLGVILASLFIISPACIVYENLLFYTYPIALLLCLSAVYLHKYLLERRQIQGVAFFSLMALVMLIRSSYHLIWFLAVVALILFLYRTNRRKILLAAVVPFTVVLLVYVKNALLFGSFGASSWLGANIHAMTTWQIPRQERAVLVGKKLLSPVALIDDPFTRLDTFRPIGFAPAPPTGIPALDQETKTTGWPNNNNLSYIDISKAYGRNAMYVIRHQPRVYLATVFKAYVIYCYPESEVWAVEDNRNRIVLADRAFNLAQGQVVYSEVYTEPSVDTAGKIHRFLQTSLLIFIGFPLLLLYGIRRLYRGYRSRVSDTTYLTTLGYILLTILYSAAISLLFSVSENSRYRFEADPLILTLAGMALQGLAERWRSRHRLQVASPAVEPVESSSF